MDNESKYRSSKEILKEWSDKIRQEPDDDVDLNKYIPIKWLETLEDFYNTEIPADRSIRRHYWEVLTSWEISGKEQWKDLKEGKIENSLYWGVNAKDSLLRGTGGWTYVGEERDTPHEVMPTRIAPYDGTATIHHFYNSAAQPYSAIYVLLQEVKRCRRGDEDKMVAGWNGMFDNDSVIFNQKVEEYKELSGAEYKKRMDAKRKQIEKCRTCKNSKVCIGDEVKFECCLPDGSFRECITGQFDHWE